MAQKDSRSHQAADRVYQDFEPSYEWAQDEGSDTLILMLRGFRKENLRVQISTSRILKINGEQQVNENTWRRFRKEFKVPSYSDTNGIKAKFEGGLLYVRIPKVITKAKLPTTKATPVAPNHETDKREKPRQDKTEAKPESTPTQKTPHEEPKTSDVSQKKPQEQASYEAKEKGKTGADDNNVVQDKTKATTSEDQVMHEKTDGLDKGENKVHERSSPTLYGLIMERGMQKKLVNLLVVILVLLLGLYVKNAIKSSFGGSRIQEL